MKDLYLSKCRRTCELDLVLDSADQLITLACCLVKIEGWPWEIFRKISDEVITFIVEILLFAGYVEFRADPAGYLLCVHHEFRFSQEKRKLGGTKIQATLFIPLKSTF